MMLAAGAPALDPGLAAFFGAVAPYYAGAAALDDVTRAIGPSPSGSARMDFYRRLMAANRRRNLAHVFPLVARVVNEPARAGLAAGALPRWADLVERHAAAHPAPSWDPNEAGAAFPAWLAADPALPAGLAPLAAWSWALLAVSRAADGGPPGGVAAAVRVDAYPFDVAAWAAAFEAGAAPALARGRRGGPAARARGLPRPGDAAPARAAPSACRARRDGAGLGRAGRPGARRGRGRGRGRSRAARRARRAGGRGGRAMRPLLAPLALLALAGALLACGDDLPDGVEALSIAPVTHWEALGAVEMVPPVRLPTRAGGASRTRVLVAIAGDGLIDVEERDGRALLVFPAGATADRVEEARVDGGWAIADVRGTDVTADGERFHLLRPVAMRPGAELRGFAWPRAEAALDGWVHDRVAAGLARGDGVAAALPQARRDAMATGLRERADCARCHDHARPPTTAAGAAVHRGTDGSGFYVPASVLADEVPLERYRPDDPNVPAPWLAVRCDDGSPARYAHEKTGRRWRCAGGEVPTARVDLAAALAAGDPHAAEVCASRRWLGDHMTPRARAAFAAALAPCGR
ncbi:MAG: putative DNA-binding domain-containing protein [Deltaproteobacteria bacterium]|nr:putative DNA-binding domain-containing protein [Deltaproteobacteria bacterium]